MQKRDKKEPSPAEEEEQARPHTNNDTSSKTRKVDPNIDYEKYPDYEVSELDVGEKVDDHVTPQGDMSDIYRPEGEFGLARRWLRAVYDLDAEGPVYSDEIAAWERQKEVTGESIYLPPGRTIDDFKWGRPLDKHTKQK